MLKSRLVSPLAIALIASCGGPPSEDSGLELAPVPGGQLEYEVRGDGEPVLFIHGGFIAATFLPVVADPALEGYRLIRYHRRGYARSTSAGDAFSIEQHAADAAALLRHLGVNRAHVVGHSGGGIVAVQFALDYPDLVHSLALLEPPIDLFGREREPGDRGWEGDPVGALDEFFIGVGGPNWKEDLARTVPGGLEQAERDAARSLAVATPALRKWVFDVEKAGRISVPILHMRGEDGSSSAILETLWPARERYEVPGTNHMFLIQDPATTASGIAEFISRHPF